MELENFEITGVTPVVQNPSAALYCLPKQLIELRHCKIETFACLSLNCMG